MKYWERCFCSLMFICCLPEILCEAIKYYDKEIDESFFKYLVVNLDIAYEDIFEV